MRKLSKDPASSNLKVTVFWGDILFDTALCRPNSSISIGRKPGNTFILDLDQSFHKESLEIVHVNLDESADFRFDDSINGHVRLGEEVFSLISAKKTTHVTKDPNGLYHIRLSKKDKANISIGHVSIYFDWIQGIKTIPRSAPVDRKNALIFGIFSLFSLFLMILLTGPWLLPPEPEPPPERLVTLIPRQPTKAAVGEKKTGDGGSQTGELGKADLKQSEEPPSEAAALKRANLGSLVSDLASLGKNAPNVANAPAGGAKARISQVGSGGFSTEGIKTGGGGKSVGIGRTVGQGEGGFEGTGRLGLSGESLTEGGTGHGSDGSVEVGGLDRDVIESIIRRRQERIRLCYERQLNFNPSLAGKISIHFVIGPKGSVLKSEIIEDTMKNANVKNCILAEVKTWNFPAPAGGTLVNVDYPFVFESSSKRSQL